MYRRRVRAVARLYWRDRAGLYLFLFWLVAVAVAGGLTGR